MPTLRGSTGYSLPLLLVQSGLMFQMLLSLTLFALTLILEMRYSSERQQTRASSQSGSIGVGLGTPYTRGEWNGLGRQ